MVPVSFTTLFQYSYLYMSQWYEYYLMGGYSVNKLREGVLRVFVCAYVFSTHIYMCVTCLSVYLLVTHVTFMTEGTRV